MFAIIPAVVLMLTVSDPAVYAVEQGRKTGQKPKTDNEAAIEFCRQESLLRLKHQKTVKWLDFAKEESAGTFLVSGVRDAQSPAGETQSQTFTCRVEKAKTGWTLRMIQLFKESTKTGRDVFETNPPKK